MTSFHNIMSHNSDNLTPYLGHVVDAYRGRAGDLLTGRVHVIGLVQLDVDWHIPLVVHIVFFFLNTYFYCTMRVTVAAVVCCIMSPYQHRWITVQSCTLL